MRTERLLPIARLLVVLTGALAAATAHAQRPSEPAGAPPTDAPIQLPPPPDVNDPMLAPVPSAPRSLATLDEALALVKSRSTDLRIARLEVERAVAASRIALAGLLPTINGSVAGTKNFITRTTQSLGFDLATTTITNTPVTTPTDSVYFTGSAVLVQPIVNARNLHSYGTAREFERAQMLSLEDVQRSLALNLADALVSVVTAERVAELNRIGFRNALERLDLTRRKQRLGAANGLDVVRAQQDVEATRATLVTGDESLRQAREALGLAVGLPHQVGVTRDLNIDGLERAATIACRPTKSLEERADVAAARQRLYVAERNFDNVKLQFLPTLNLQSALATTTLDTGIAPNTTWNIQGVLSVPLWEGGARYGALRDARAQAEEARQNLEALRRNATVQLEQARRGVAVAEASRKVSADERALAAETDRLTRVGYMEGQGTSLELVVAASALRQADVNLAVANFGLVKARILAILSLANCPW
jgi:outer membrane protein, multidrug efflux system